MNGFKYGSAGLLSLWSNWIFGKRFLIINNKIMFEKPEWAKLFPVFQLISEEEIKSLERFRDRHNVSHNDFSSVILESAMVTLKVQEYSYKKLKNMYPDKEEKQILRLIIIDRYFEKTEDEIDMIMSKISSLDDLCKYIIKQDELENPKYKQRVANMLSTNSGDKDDNNNDIGKETWGKAERIYPYSYICSSIEESPAEFEEKINRGTLSTESYNIKSFEKIWELINLSNDKILGINWDEGKSVSRDEIEKKIISLGFKIKPMQNPMFITFNREFVFGDIVQGSVILLKNGMLHCYFHFVSKNAEGLIKFLEQKYGKYLNFQDDMIREFKYYWIIGDVILSVDVSKISKFASIGFDKNVDFAKLHRGEIDSSDL